MNYQRIIAIAGLTFCTTLIATGFNTQSAIINAILTTGVAAFTEMKSESEPIKKVIRALANALVI